MELIKEILAEYKPKMDNLVEHLRIDLATLRAGRANPALLNKIMVEYYGVPTPVNQLANVSVPEPRMIQIQPWEKNIVDDVCRAIIQSDLGLNPNSDGTVIRLSLPMLTEERRKELVKTANKMTEECRIAVRNIRRDAIDDIKDLEKSKDISEDECHVGQDDVQKMTDGVMKDIDAVIERKEKEIMEV